MKISYWIDYNCPYCYLGITRLNNAINKLKLEDVKIDTHAFELDPNAPKTCQNTTLERFSKKYNMTKEDAQKEIDKITKWGTDDGLNMKYESCRFTNTRDAHRLAKLAIQSNNQEIISEFNNALFEAYFSENLELADKETLKDLATKAGLNKKDVIEVLDSNKFDNEVELDERVALDTGIQGVPYFIFNNKYPIPGVLPESEFVNVLKKIKFEEEFAEKINSKQNK